MIRNSLFDILRFKRTLPPAAAPIPLTTILKALPSSLQKNPENFQFEKEIKQEFNQSHCFLVSSGKAALTLILKALQNLHPERDEVLIPAFTCYSVPAAIKKAGLKITLCDTGVDSLDFDKNQLKKIIAADKKENKILCILVTHLFGCPADFTAIKEIVEQNIPIIEDAAQAMGEKINNRKIGTLGEAGFFSLGRGKSLSTMEGGIIITSKTDLGKELTRLIKNIEIYAFPDRIKLAVKTILTTVLQHPYLFWLPKALPFLKLGETIYEEDFPIFKMSAFQEKLSHNWRERLKGHQKVRRKNIAFWLEHLPNNLSLICTGQKIPSLIRLPVLANSEKERDNLCFKSEKNGCGIMPTYPAPIDEIPQIADEFVDQKYPNAKKLSECLLTLPIHEYVNERDRVKIKNLITTAGQDNKN